jgi:1,4-dihydroxy-2-naphthoate octaprenyltransferase
MNAIQKLTCAFTTKQSLTSYYEGLSDEQLLARKQTNKKTALYTTAGWALALILTLGAAKMSIAVTILYTGVIITIFVTTFVDLQDKNKKIDQILRNRRN